MLHSPCFLSVCAILLVLNIRKMVKIQCDCTTLMTLQEYSIGGDEFGLKSGS